MQFSAQELADKCWELLSEKEYSTERLPSFPSAHWYHSKHSNQKCVGVFISEESLQSLSLEDFSEKILQAPITELRYKCGDGTLSAIAEPFELPKGVDFAAASSNGKVRVIGMEDHVPTTLRDSNFYPKGEVKFNYDMNKEAVFKVPMAPVIRIDVRVAE